jgi:hypothetical protein
MKTFCNDNNDVMSKINARPCNTIFMESQKQHGHMINKSHRWAGGTLDLLNFSKSKQINSLKENLSKK